MVEFHEAFFTTSPQRRTGGKKNRSGRIA